jgi:hypothetical protein
MQRSGVLLLVVGLIQICLTLTSPAAAHRCPRGLILRVHLGRCVSIHSSLSRGFVQHRHMRHHSPQKPEPEDYYVNVTIKVRPEVPAPPPEPEISIPYRLDGSVMWNPAARAAPYWRH